MCCCILYIHLFEMNASIFIKILVTYYYNNITIFYFFLNKIYFCQFLLEIKVNYQFINS